MISKMLQIKRTDAGNPDFVSLVRLLDADLAERDGADHAFYAQFNKVDTLQYVVVGYEDEIPVACGAFKPFNEHTVEVKRMFVQPPKRGRGFATQILRELERWAEELQYRRCILETGKRQPEAIALYLKNGYGCIPNFGQYAGVENSVCFEKALPYALGY